MIRIILFLLSTNKNLYTKRIKILTLVVDRRKEVLRSLMVMLRGCGGRNPVKEKGHVLPAGAPTPKSVYEQ